jgi:prepilin-type N-terminal cleavage/methylation domain-containing protein
MSWFAWARRAASARRRGTAGRGFTLVELLVVIGIIALLIGILLPTLGRARERARQVKCMSNVRQLSMAALMFANDNRGLMPARGGTDSFSIDPASGRIERSVVLAIRAGASLSNFDDSDWVKVGLADWIAWKRRKDPLTGITNTAVNQNITYSGLTRYLGSKLLQTPAGDFDAANRANVSLEQIFRCPSDNLQQRPSANDSSHGFYRYSYALNVAYANPVARFNNAVGGPAFEVGERSDGRFTGQLSSIKSPSDKVLFICQDEKTLDDGSFNPNPYNWNVTGSDSRIVDVLSSRHTKANARANSKNSSGGNNREGYEDVLGNVGFADGHGAILSRKDALRRKHSGNPNPDPAGF